MRSGQRSPKPTRSGVHDRFGTDTRGETPLSHRKEGNHLNRATDKKLPIALRNVVHAPEGSASVASAEGAAA